MRRLVAYYCFVLITLIVTIGLLSAQTIPQLVSAALFYPLAAYFTLVIWPKRKRAVSPSRQINIIKEESQESDETTEPKLTKIHQKTSDDFDKNRRVFLKLIGSAGLTVFFATIFTKKAEAAFFGSVPGSGTISLKDASGVKIDPAEKQPTDGYKITQVDDSTPAYYGFMNKSGAWFIQREEATGAYRYAKGTSDFATNWTGRAGLSYDYYDTVF